MLIKVIQVPFKNPPGFESVLGFNPNGISMDELGNFPRFKQTCYTTYDILADVLFPVFPPRPFFCPLPLTSRLSI